MFKLFYSIFILRIGLLEGEVSLVKSRNKDEGVVRLDGQEIPNSESFQYLGSIWISGNTRKYRIRNEKIHLKIRVTPFDVKMRESRLRWFGHVQKREINARMRHSELIQVERMKKKNVKENQK